MEGAPFHEWILENGKVWTQFYREAGGYRLRFPDLADFQVAADALSVVCRPAHCVSRRTTEHLYLNQVWPLLLSKRGHLVFHAAAVEIGEHAIAFMGASGRGKSTLAASFAGNGYRLLTDDGLVLQARADGPCQAVPTHASVDLQDDRTAPARPLRRAYFLGGGSGPALCIEPMTAAAAMTECLKCSFILDLDTRRMVSYFNYVADLANQPVFFRLDFPRRLEDLPLIRQAIIDHAGQ